MSRFVWLTFSAVLLCCAYIVGWGGLVGRMDDKYFMTSVFVGGRRHKSNRNQPNYRTETRPRLHISLTRIISVLILFILGPNCSQPADDKDFVHLSHKKLEGSTENTKILNFLLSGRKLGRPTPQYCCLTQE